MSASSRADDAARPVIYQLMVRTFGNTNETRKTNGTLAENGCGKFADINAAALASLKEMGFTHLWLTGVLEQASGTAYPDRPADDPDILKGIAGSPYAIKDYFDVCPDYAVDPDKRLDEFKALLGRCQAARAQGDHRLRAQPRRAFLCSRMSGRTSRSARATTATCFSTGTTISTTSARASRWRPAAQAADRRAARLRREIRAGDQLRPRHRQQRGFLGSLDQRLV